MSRKPRYQALDDANRRAAALVQEALAATQERAWRPLGGATRTHGRSSYLLECPFCEAAVVVFAWSFAGSGKKRCGCGAMLHRDGMARTIEGRTGK